MPTRECRQIVRRIQRKAPDSFVGDHRLLCPAQTRTDRFHSRRQPGTGAAEKFNIARHLQELTKGDPARICSCDISEVSGFSCASWSSTPHPYLLKVQDGCDLQLFFLHHFLWPGA